MTQTVEQLTNFRQSFELNFENIRNKGQANTLDNSVVRLLLYHFLVDRGGRWDAGVF